MKHHFQKKISCMKLKNFEVKTAEKFWNNFGKVITFALSCRVDIESVIRFISQGSRQVGASGTDGFCIRVQKDTIHSVVDLKHSHYCTLW